ncbi:JAB domain-containing protein [Azospirillum brasilense]|uniref:MPN domain-containing protein n=1 Tax=Azospirillum brasilense TaxID=192 RepID=A0A6L3ARN7_AZOBR|nr:JAB domain-containing protein [Azospirillum brasilense]KAA0677297.1 hypothetical protein DS837_29380 [Azospirillum brasilense]
MLEGTDVGMGGAATHRPQPPVDARDSVPGVQGGDPLRGGQSGPAKSSSRQAPSTAKPPQRAGLQGRGFEAIPDGQLLAHLLALTTEGKEADADCLADRLLHHFGSLADVVAAPAPRLRQIARLDERGLLSMRLVWEVAARLAWQETVHQPLLATTPALLAYCQMRLARERVDQVRALYLDVQHHLIADERHQVGTAGTVEVYPREILRRALELDAVGVIVARGQVRGSARLSANDRSSAKALEAGGQALGIRLTDYVVVARGGHCSYRGERQSR